MKQRAAFALVVASALAAGCASAHAQDEGGGNPPPPHERPEGRHERRPPEADRGPGVERRNEDAAARMREAVARVHDAEARVAQLKEMEKRADSDPEVREAVRMLESARAMAMETKERMTANRDPMAPGFAPNPEDPRWKMAEEKRRFVKDHPRFEGAGPGAFNGPAPSFEQRLEQVERAIREMHAMFERHNVPQEWRERAEREMRMENGGPPQQGGDRRPGAPEAGGPDRPHAPEAGPDRPRPPVRMPKFEMTPEERRAIEQKIGPEAAETKKQLDGARAEIDALRRQLEETRAAMEKMRAEMEQLRGEKK